ncbi:unnamed protein product [Closterium sp. Naga37s-1]|nr:unnamed protein product [Closterium sp. Naga37s-1]
MVEREKHDKLQREEEERKREEARKVEREKEEKRQREEEERKWKEEREREKQDKLQREEEERKREEARKVEREKEEKRQMEEEEREREEASNVEREKEDKRKREEEERKREEARKVEREKEEKRQMEEEERKREEATKVERKKEEKRQREEEERKEEERKVEREKEEKRQREEEERNREEARKVECEKEEKRQREEEERKREERKAEREKEENRQREEEERKREEASKVEREKEEKRQREEEERKREEASKVEREKEEKRQRGEEERKREEASKGDRREENERRGMGGALPRHERPREVAGLGGHGAEGQRGCDGTRHTSEGQRDARVFQTQAGRGAGEGARQVVVDDQPTDVQQGTTVRRAAEVGLARLGTGGSRLQIQRDGGRCDDQTARNRVGEGDRRRLEQSRQAGRREGEARRTLQGERVAEEQVWRGVGWAVKGGREEEELESAASALPIQRRRPRATENPAAVQAEELEEGEWVAVERVLQEQENAGAQVFEETAGGFEEAVDRIAASGRVHTTSELMRRLTLVARSVARISSEQGVRFSECMAEIRQFGSQMHGWDVRYLQDYDDLTHEYQVLKDSVVREREELVQLRTAFSTSAAEARAAAADAGRAAAAVAVGALQEKLVGFSETFGENLKGVVE